MQQLDLQVRYFQDSTPLGVPCREENFVRRQIRMSLPLAQTALVLVDMWNDHFNDSWLERAGHLPGAAVVPSLGRDRRGSSGAARLAAATNSLVVTMHAHCESDGRLWLSYYSTHEEKTSIYLAQIVLPDD